MGIRHSNQYITINTVTVRRNLIIGWEHITSCWLPYENGRRQTCGVKLYLRDGKEIFVEETHDSLRVKDMIELLNRSCS
jgi:hypothetical protein